MLLGILTFKDLDLFFIEAAEMRHRRGDVFLLKFAFHDFDPALAADDQLTADCFDVDTQFPGGIEDCGPLRHQTASAGWLKNNCMIHISYILLIGQMPLPHGYCSSPSARLPI